jgi:hypothetical protein
MELQACQAERSDMRNLIVGLGSALLVAALPPALAGDWEDDAVWIERSIEVNGRTVQEIRMGGAPGGDEVVVLVVTNGPTSGTSLAAKTIALEELFFGDVVDFDELGDGQFFSISDSCHLGGADVFVYIDNFKPKGVRVRDGEYEFFLPPVSAGDQYTGASCTVSSDGSRIHYMFQNRTQARLEFWRESPLGTVVNENAGIVSVGDVFAGFSRPALGTGPGNDLTVFYQRNDGLMRDLVFDGVTHVPRQICAGHHEMPAPTTFVAPREVAKLAVSLRAGISDYRFGSLSDFDRNGVIDLATSSSGGGCGQATTAYGGVGNAAPYGWTGYVAIPEPDAAWSWVGNGNSFGVFVHATGQNAPMTAPPVRAGGPIAGIAVRDNDTGQPGGLLGATSLIDPSDVTFAYTADVPEVFMGDTLFHGSFERPGPGRIGTRMR